MESKSLETKTARPLLKKATMAATDRKPFDAGAVASGMRRVLRKLAEQNIGYREFFNEMKHHAPPGAIFSGDELRAAFKARFGRSVLSKTDVATIVRNLDVSRARRQGVVFIVLVVWVSPRVLWQCTRSSHIVLV